MIATGLNLLIPEKQDCERDSVAQSFAKAGGIVHRVSRFWDPPAFDVRTVRVYGPDSFCLVLQQKLGLTPCSPDDHLLLRVPSEFLKREVRCSTLGGSSSLDFPCFVKPVIPKQFNGAVYQSNSELATECRGLPPATEVFVSGAVTLLAEARMFVLYDRVLDVAIYEGKGEATGAGARVAELVHAMSLPATVVVDVGFIEGRGWGVIDFNASWGAGLNGCDPEKVLPAIMAASSP